MRWLLKMQVSVPEVMDINNEPNYIKGDVWGKGGA